MGISSSILPDNSIYITIAYSVAIEICSMQLCGVPAYGSGQYSIYNLAVYNLGGSNVLNYAQDLPGAPVVQPSKNGLPALPFFADYRRAWNMNGFVSGVVQSSGDEGTNVSLVVQEAAKNFTLADLQYLKDPYGRQYLAFAQRLGTLWGIS